METSRIRVIFCQCVHRDLAPALLQAEVLRGLQGSGVDLLVVPDLCEQAVRRDRAILEFVAFSDLRVAACYPRAVKWLLRYMGASTAGECRVGNLRVGSAASVLEQLLGAQAGGQSDEKCSPVPGAAVGGDWVPWYPVLDRDLCVRCGQCVSFCPFGVYTRDPGGDVTVTSPANCKNNCPACARICPELAIIFPKVAEAPINGAEVSEDARCAARRRSVERMREMGAGDLHGLLAERKRRAAARRAGARS